MLLKPLTLAAGLLAVPATQAFLVPPEVSDADVQVANTIESIGAQVAQTQVIDVECPGCPILLTGRRGKHIQVYIDRPSHLELTFSVDHQPDHDRLLVNGLPIYPSDDLMRTTLLSAPQIVDREDKEKRHRPEHDHHDREHRRRPHKVTPQPQKLGFGLHVGTSQKDADGQFELVELELQIIAVGVAFIDGIPNVKVKLVKDAEGRLLMSQIEKGEPKQMLHHPGSGAEECTTVMCQWLAFARAKLEKLKNLKGFKNCHGGKGGMKPPVSGEAPHHHPHHPAPDNWRAPYHEHRWGKLLKHMASHILLPVLIGIVAGVSVSLVGMAVGTVIVSLWRVLFRRRRHSHHSHHHKAARKEAVFEEEKSGLMAYQDAPPSYEEQEEEEEVVKAAQV
ncbi:hypothetical protein C8A01DRAFT_33818 [Parachaetomium inaequale]|uniref:DUF7728 domain-containing protein n=1 Tax=Parachaetomium inaequale TaxID=2588326 RepID=A0AAN6SU37_9PEZI|nr:hypothetical protein C8A01DRAFT_33818 [Parachaetomium inaequale]